MIICPLSSRHPITGMLYFSRVPNLSRRTTSAQNRRAVQASPSRRINTPINSMSAMIMNTPVIAPDAQTSAPTNIEIIESVDSPTWQRSRLALIPARPIAIQSIHLTPDEFMIVPQKEVAAQPREPRLAQSSG